MPMPMWGYSAGFGWVGFMWMALNVLFWLAVVGVLAWALARWLGHQPFRTDVHSAPATSASDVPTPVPAPQFVRHEIDEPPDWRMSE